MTPDPSLPRLISMPQRNDRDAICSLKPNLWIMKGGYLLLYGSALSGEVQLRGVKKTSLSDIDFLWCGVGEPPSPPAISTRARSVAGAHKVGAFSHIGVKVIPANESFILPNWLTNAWLPALKEHIRNLPKLETLLPASLLLPRSLEGADLAAGLDFAWRYAALSLASAKPRREAACYAVAKLYLVLIRLELQVCGRFPLSYRETVELANTRRRPQLDTSLAIKTGRKQRLTSKQWMDTWIAARTVTEDLLARQPSPTSEQYADLTLALSNWALVDSNRDVRSAFAQKIAGALQLRSAQLPTFEAAKKPLYEEAVTRWLSAVKSLPSSASAKDARGGLPSRPKQQACSRAQTRRSGAPVRA
jgi:hypothetical protein